jgi:hypothetical protein
MEYDKIHFLAIDECRYMDGVPEIDLTIRQQEATKGTFYKEVQKILRLPDFTQFMKLDESSMAITGEPLDYKIMYTLYSNALLIERQAAQFKKLPTYGD